MLCPRLRVCVKAVFCSWKLALRCLALYTIKSELTAFSEICFMSNVTFQQGRLWRQQLKKRRKKKGKRRKKTLWVFPDFKFVLFNRCTHTHTPKKLLLEEVKHEQVKIVMKPERSDSINGLNKRFPCSLRDNRTFYSKLTNVELITAFIW